MSWNNQSGATSYKIERQSVDYFVNNQSLTIPTKWTELTNTTETNFTVDHDLLSFDMGGHQNFRLSKCVDTTCEVLAQLNYFLLAKEHQNTIPQNFTITSDTASTTANLDIAKQANVKNNGNASNNRFDRGYGFSMVFGHSDDPEPETTSASRKSAQTLRSASQQTQDYVLRWNAVDKASSYVIMRYDDKGDSPSKAFINRVDMTHETLLTQYHYQLLSGTYHFEIYACYKAGASGYTYEHCGGESIKQTVTGVSIDVISPDLQPQNVAYSDPDAIVASGQAFDITWNNPTNTANLDGFAIYGELSGYLGYRLYQSGNSYTFTRNSGQYNEPKLQAGRQYCYKVIPSYIDSNNNLTDGEAGRPPAPNQCITVGDGTVIDALQKLTTVKQIKNPIFKKTRGVTLSWYYNDFNSTVEHIPANVEYYQLDRETVVGSGEWNPIYYGPQKYKTLYLEEINSGLSYSFRVSACDIQGNCGNYRRLYFYVDGFDEEDIKEHTSPPACIHVDPVVNSGDALDIQWCKSGTSATPNYQVVNAKGTIVFDSATNNFTMTDNGMMKIQVNNMTNLDKNNRCFKVIAKYVGDTKNYETQQQCTEISPNVPTNFVAATGAEHIGGVHLDWDDMPDTYNYRVYQAYCDNSCSAPQDSDWTHILNVDPALASQAYINITSNGNYFYRVSACGSLSTICSAYTPTLSVEVLTPQIPGQPSISLIEPTTRTAQLDWAAVPGATEYVVEWADCGDDCSTLTQEQWQRKGITNTTQLSMPNMTSGLFAFSVKACNIVCSDRSIPATLELIFPDAPVNVVASIIDLSSRQFQLRWNPTEDASSYVVQRALCSNGCSNVTDSDWQTLTTVTTSQASFTTPAGETYTLKVAACSSTGLCSDYSSAADTPSGVRAIRYIHSDNLGSPVAETDENGTEQ